MGKGGLRLMREISFREKYEKQIAEARKLKTYLHNSGHGNVHGNVAGTGVHNNHGNAPHDNDDCKSHRNSHSNAHSNGTENTHNNHQNDAHTNTFTTGTSSYSPAVTGSHSQSVTQLASGVTSSRMGNKGGTGALTEIKGLVNRARTESENSNLNSTYDPGSEVNNMTGTMINGLLESSYATSKQLYPNGTISAKASININGATASIDKTVTNAATSPNEAIDFGPHTFNTPLASYTFNGDLASAAAVNSSINTDSGVDFSATRGTYITKAQINEAVSKIKKITNNVPSFGTSRYGRTDGSTATYQVTHGNHSNHSQHNSHGSAAHYDSHSSCRRTVKDNIELYLESALDILNKVSVVSFNYNDMSGEDTNIKHIGFIAEDTPEELSTLYRDRMDYTNCIGLLIKAVQELSSKLE